MDVYVHITTNMCVYACICVHDRIYILNRVIYAEIGFRIHSYTGSAVEVNTVYCGDGCSRPENAQTFCIILNTYLPEHFRRRISPEGRRFLVLPCKKEEIKNRYIHTYTYIYCNLVYVYACICLYLHE